MGERLTALDATFLELEEADDGAHMHIGAVMVLAGPAPPVESVRAALAARLDVLPPVHAAPLVRSDRRAALARLGAGSGFRHRPPRPSPPASRNGRT